MSERRTPPGKAEHRRGESPVLPDVTADERDEGWGDRPDERDSARSKEWYQRERPPHHE